MALGVAMTTALYAFRKLAGELECISRRPGWLVDAAVFWDRRLHIYASIPPESSNEFDGVPRAGHGEPVPRKVLPGGVAAIAEALLNVPRNRGLNGFLRIFNPTIQGRDAWVFEVTVMTPSEGEQRRLKNHR